MSRGREKASLVSREIWTRNTGNGLPKATIQYITLRDYQTLIRLPPSKRQALGISAGVNICPESRSRSSWATCLAPGLRFAARSTSTTTPRSSNSSLFTSSSAWSSERRPSTSSTRSTSVCPIPVQQQHLRTDHHPVQRSPQHPARSRASLLGFSVARKGGGPHSRCSTAGGRCPLIAQTVTPDCTPDCSV